MYIIYIIHTYTYMYIYIYTYYTYIYIYVHIWFLSCECSIMSGLKIFWVQAYEYQLSRTGHSERSPKLVPPAIVLSLGCHFADHPGAW